ncbi:MAG: hypothetical protein ACRCUJ_09075 [Phocaeicola sp.]
MAKVLRLNNIVGNDTINSWGQTVAYGKSAIDSIVDPNGATAKKEITSIPSPFARIDLVKTAFKQIKSEKELDGTTIYHKLISDCLDVGEIFFKIKKYKDKVQIIPWDLKSELAALTNSTSAEHVILGETLHMFLDQDASTYNFDRLKRIYLLNYIGPGAPNLLNIIGATSPSTLFFTSANNLDYVSGNISFGNGRPFDGVYQPLYKRDLEYVKFWFSFRLVWSATNTISFSSAFPEIDDYLNLTFKVLDEDSKKIIWALTQLDYSELDDIVVDTAANYVEILGVNLKGNTTSISPTKSQFLIHHDSHYISQGKIPMVLPIDKFMLDLVYVTAPWDPTTDVPFKDPKSISERLLPNDGSNYPYLTIGDFLEESIICNEYKGNSADFFTGDSAPDDSYSYLLPIKKEYFNYFDLSTLKKNFALEHRNIGGQKVVKVTLKIAINNGLNHIVYTKTYYENKNDLMKAQDGNIVTKRFTIAITPPIINSQVKPDYRIALLNRLNEGIDSTPNPLQAYFYSLNGSSKKIDPVDIIQRNADIQGNVYVKYRMTAPIYVLDQNFDYLQIDFEGTLGIVVPTFLNTTGSKTFEFAVDFGTSNTHIEFKQSGELNSTPFILSKESSSIKYLNEGLLDDAEVKEILFSDFLPSEIGTKVEDEFRFPIRTALSEKHNVDWSRDFYPLAHANVAFLYEKQKSLEYNNLRTNLKWSSEKYTPERVACYIANILMLIRNKVLSEGGDLGKTKITWFYPTSMSVHKQFQLSKVWNDQYKRYIGDDTSTSLSSMPESIAPYYYSKHRMGASSHVVTIDIGGGTTDVLLAQAGEVKNITSMRFAANSIFGDAFTNNINLNGFVRKFLPEIDSVLQNNQLKQVSSVLDEIHKTGISYDVNTFFFSLQNNQELRKKKLNIDYNMMLANNPECKIIFIIFYASLIYHIARIMQVNNMVVPRNIAFSGTGSKVLQILVDTSDDSHRAVLEKLTKLIFEEVYQQSYNRDGLEILIDPDRPKEATCKGGLVANSRLIKADEISGYKIFLLGTKNGEIVTNESEYKKMTDGQLKGVADEVNDFFSMLFKLNEKYSFQDYFGTVSTQRLKELKPIMQRDIIKYIQDGINQRVKELEAEGQELKVSETLFFYPIIGVMNAISQQFK